MDFPCGIAHLRPEHLRLCRACPGHDGEDALRAFARARRPIDFNDNTDQKSRHHRAGDEAKLRRLPGHDGDDGKPGRRAYYKGGLGEAVTHRSVTMDYAALVHPTKFRRRSRAAHRCHCCEERKRGSNPALLGHKWQIPFTPRTSVVVGSCFRRNDTRSARNDQRVGD